MAEPVLGAQDAGDAVIKFSGSKTDVNSMYVAGDLKLPFEESKPIKRLEFQGLTPTTRLFGQWLMTFQSPGNSSSYIHRAVHLSKLNGSTIVSDDGLVNCNLNPVSSFVYKCELYNDSLKSVKLGEFESRFNGFTVDRMAIQLRDRFGNWRGIGKIFSE